MLKGVRVCSTSGSDLGRSAPRRDPMRYESVYPTFRPAAQARKQLGCSMRQGHPRKCPACARDSIIGRERCRAIHAHAEPHDEILLLKRKIHLEEECSFSRADSYRCGSENWPVIFDDSGTDRLRGILGVYN